MNERKQLYIYLKMTVVYNSFVSMIYVISDVLMILSRDAIIASDVVTFSIIQKQNFQTVQAESFTTHSQH